METLSGLKLGPKNLKLTAEIRPSKRSEIKIEARPTPNKKELISVSSVNINNPMEGQIINLKVVFMDLGKMPNEPKPRTQAAKNVSILQVYQREYREILTC